MKKILLAIFWGGVLKILFSQEVFFGPGEIHYDMDNALQLYQEKRKPGLSLLEEICGSFREFSHYACFCLAKLYFKEGQRKKAKFFIDKSLEKKANFVPAVNFYLLHFKEVPSLENKALYHYLKALKFAREKKSAKVNKEIELSIKEKASFEWYLQNPIFLPYIKKHRLFENLPQEKQKIANSTLTDEKARLFDYAYTFEKHLANPDPLKITYEYFEALRNLKEGPFFVQKNLQDFLLKLEKEQKELAPYVLLFLWQKPEFVFLKTEPSWKEFSIDFGKKYGIQKDFFK